MDIKVCQWNIGGGIIYPNKEMGLDAIADTISNFKPEIVTFQEVLKYNGTEQIDILGNLLGLDYRKSNYYADSHLLEGVKSGHGILSKFPIIEHNFIEFLNPKLQFTHKSGAVWKTHNKGVTTCELQINDKNITVATTHLLPLNKFGASWDSSNMRYVVDDIQYKINIDEPKVIINGDFNYPSAKIDKLLTKLFTEGYKRLLLKSPTAADGTSTDNILYKGIEIFDVKTIDTVKTDRFPTIYTIRI